MGEPRSPEEEGKPQSPEGHTKITRDPNTGETIVETYCYEYGAEGRLALTQKVISRYNKDGRLIHKTIMTTDDGGRCMSFKEQSFDPQTGNVISSEESIYDPETRRLKEFITEVYDPQTGKIVSSERSIYDPKIRNLEEFITEEFDPQTGKLLSRMRTIHWSNAGRLISEEI